MSQQRNVQVFNPEGYPSLAPSYSHISVVQLGAQSKLVSFAGQTGVIDSSSGRHAATFADQVRAALANVDKCLAAAGIGKDSIVSAREYVVELASRPAEDLKARTDVYLEWWRATEGETSLPPPDTLIGVHSLATKEIWFEIEVTCVAGV